jgi:hypothetical protein
MARKTSSKRRKAGDKTKKKRSNTTVSSSPGNGNNPIPALHGSRPTIDETTSHPIDCQCFLKRVNQSLFIPPPIEEKDILDRKA